MRFNQKRRAALNKELLAVEKQEKKLRDSALRAVSAGWKTELERRIPAKVLDSLKIAFQKGFSMTFDHGRAVIEHSYSREELQADYEIREFAVERKGGRQELRQMHRSARQEIFATWQSPRWKASVWVCWALACRTLYCFSAYC